jgi:TRAP-type mannitol/chloroaromatic compound transport system permease small subunit
MRQLKKALRVIDSISEHGGASIALWFVWLIVLAGTYDTIARHFFNAPTVWAYDTLCMGGGVVYALGWAYDHRHNAHIRVDIIYRSLSPRKKALWDAISTCLFFFPLMVALSISSISWAIKAWRINETMISTFWYPPAAPYRTVFAIGIILLTLQGVANFIRHLHFLIRGESLD